MKKRSGAPRSAASSGDPYCPDAGDIIWLDFDPQAGHQQAGRRPALVLSPRIFNQRPPRLCVACPMTSRVRGGPWEVPMPPDFSITGVVLSDQLKSASWQARKARFECVSPNGVLVEVKAKIRALLQLG